MEKQSCLQHLKASESEYGSLVTLTSMALTIEHRDLTDRVGPAHVCPDRLPYDVEQQGLPLFSEHVLQHPVVSREVTHEPLQLSVLPLEHPQALAYQIGTCQFASTRYVLDCIPR